MTEPSRPKEGDEISVKNNSEDVVIKKSTFNKLLHLSRACK